MLTREVINRSFWALPKGEVLDILETSVDGLAEEDVTERLTIFKKNVLPQMKRLGKLAIFFRQFESPLIILLFVAVLITALLGDFEDFGSFFGKIPTGKNRKSDNNPVSMKG